MEKSNIIGTAAIDQLVNNAVGYLKTWTQKELANIIEQNKNGKPLIIKIPDRGYVVGDYFLENHNHWWKVKYRYSDRELVFSNKLSAVYYAVCMETGRFKSANRIAFDDEQVSRLKIKTDQYYQRFKQALKKKNSHKIDLFLVRYQESARKLENSKSLLEKTLKSAKYIKF